MYPSMPPEPGTPFSPDGYWWWNGTQWLPAFTPDHLWRFTGERWVPAGAGNRPPRWLVISGVGWLVGLVGWLIYGAVLVGISGPDGPAGNAAAYALLGMVVVAVLATVAWGFLVGRRRALRWLWPAAALGTAAQLVCYVAAMLAAPVPDDAPQDTAAGAGVAILTVPTALITVALLWFGAALGVLSRRISR